MIERSPILNIVTHVILLSGLLMLAIPIWLAFVAASHTIQDVNAIPMKTLPGDQFLVNIAEAWGRGNFGQKFLNSSIVVVGVVTGKVLIAAITAFAIVFFRYRIRMLLFWLVFITLMLPLEVRIVPTYAVAANALSPYQTMLDGLGVTWLIERLTGIELALQWNLLDSYTGLILPLVATATGTFLYRQFFLTIPDELVEAARMDGAGPLRFLIEHLLPLSKTNIAALATIMTVYAWNQYLWPLLVVTNTDRYGTVVMELRRLIPTETSTGAGVPEWNLAMAGTLVVLVPPLIVVIAMQRWFVRGLINTDK